MDKCFKCDKKLSHDEIALYKKLIGITQEQFMCIECLAKFLNCSVEALKNKIEQFRAQGCYLF